MSWTCTVGPSPHRAWLHKTYEQHRPMGSCSLASHISRSGNPSSNQSTLIHLLAFKNHRRSPANRMSSARGSSRGSWRPRYQGRGYRSNYQQSTRNTTTAPRPPSPPFGPLLQTIDGLYLDDILKAADKAAEDDGESVAIAGCECVASFNWLDHSEPTILVPGTFFCQSPWSRSGHCSC